MRRRDFLRAAAVGAGSVALGFTLTRDAIGYPTRLGSSPYGRLRSPDRNGVRLPNGFTSRVVARTGRRVPGTSHVWHGAPDGGACFPDSSGWIYVSNAELGGGAGGASAVRFDGSARITGAYRILDGTNRNCAGGATPWGSWLSCEEVDLGFVYETGPRGDARAARRPAMGRFRHEAAAADPDRQVVYLTEDEPDGCFYRFRPHAWEDLSSGVLQVLADRDGRPVWKDVPDPSAAATRTRRQVEGAIRFNGGEGAYYRAGVCYFTTKGDNRVWAYDAAERTVATLYRDNVPTAPLSGVDNITGSASGDLFVAEDGDNMEICVITPEGAVAPFLRVVGHRSSEITGPAFNPAGDRLYFSSQRGATGENSGGVTYEVAGPFRSCA